MKLSYIISDYDDACEASSIWVSLEIVSFMCFQYCHWSCRWPFTYVAVISLILEKWLYSVAVFVILGPTNMKSYTLDCVFANIF